MLLSEVKTQITRKLIGDIPMPDDKMLAAFVNEALYFVATKCVPRELIKQENVGDEKVLRLLKDGFCVMVPDTPLFDSEAEDYNAEAHLHIDEDLTFAVIDYAVSLITQMKDRQVTYHDSAIKKIQMYKSNFLREIE